MRYAVVIVMCLCLFSPVLAQPKPRVENGRPVDLRDVESIYLWTGGDEQTKGEVQRQLAAALPPLKFAESEESSDLVFTVKRIKEQGAADSSTSPVVTTATAARTRGKTIRLYLHIASREQELSPAITEVVSPLVLLLQMANPTRFGKADPAARREMRSRGTIHSTVGLKQGMNKRQVVTMLGYPTKVDGQHSFTESWIYVMSDGTLRLIFSGDALLDFKMHQKK